MSLRAGAAFTNITPEGALPNYNGALCFPSDGDSDLLCHGVVLADDRRQVAIVSCDLTFIDRGLLLRIRDAATRRTGISPEHIMVAATHTHACPAAAPSFLSGALADPLFVDLLEERIVAALSLAQERLQPVRVAAGVAATPGSEVNRRRLRPDGLAAISQNTAMPAEGQVNRKLPFLGFETPDGELVALIVNYAIHSNCCGCANGPYHRDIFGRIGDALRESAPGLSATVLLAGACGDVIWHDPEGSRRGDELARHLGRQCADLVLEAYGSAPRHAVSAIEVASRVIEIPDRPIEDSTFCHDDCRGSSEAARDRARRRYDPEEAAVRARGQTSCPVEIAGIALGDAAIVTNPAELFTAFGIEIQEGSPFRTTLVSELTNGYCGYVPTEEAFEHCGYETHRTVYTSRLVRAGGRRIAAESLDLLRELYQAQPQGGTE